MKCGLLGERLGHSYSPQIHGLFADYTYELFEKTQEQLPEFLRSGDFTGLNVTIPYKKAVIPFCNELSDRAKKLGAVNTIVRRSDGTITGHNTDYFGFHSMVKKAGLDLSGKKVLILGSGGASATVSAVVEDLGGNGVVISRKGENNYDNLGRHKDASVIVNATPVGMYPNVGVSPIDLTGFANLECVLDVIYNPARTQLILQAEELGIKTMNGLWMLVAQAKESAEWFSGKLIDDSEIHRVYHILRSSMENIILIGMPGCGKSTVGALLAQATQKQFLDADALIEQETGITIPQIFEKEGEEGFRQRESKVLAQIGMQSNLVIATGGGCVTRPVNYPSIHQNGTIVWIQRALDQLSTHGRPLSQNGKLDEMYLVRKPLYEAFADVSVQSMETPIQTTNAILSKLSMEVIK